jgi:hypothetical protein
MTTERLVQNRIEETYQKFTVKSNIHIHIRKCGEAAFNEREEEATISAHNILKSL